MPQVLEMQRTRQRSSTQIHQEAQAKPREAQLHRCLCCLNGPRNSPWISSALLLSDFHHAAKKKWFRSRSKQVLQSYLNIAQGNKNTRQGSRAAKITLGSLLTAQPPCPLRSEALGIRGWQGTPGLSWSQGALRVPGQAGTRCTALPRPPPLCWGMEDTLGNGD